MPSVPRELKSMHAGQQFECSMLIQYSLATTVPAAHPVSKVALLTCPQRTSTYEAERSKCTTYEGKRIALCSCAW